ncbi:N-lysine methyltransferase SETD6 [Arapaima gigas]
MASDAKRLKIHDSLASGDPADSPLQNFVGWCQTVGVTLSDKVYLSKVGTVAEYGMLAKEDIEAGEILFSIPRTALLSQNTTRVKDILQEGKCSLESKSGWVPLLLALMWEYTSPDSHWRPYLSLWPDFKVLDHPMFWSKNERDSLLQGTGIPDAVDADISNIQKEYSSIVVPFMHSHSDLWSPEKHTLELYKSLVAFVMAYSFQEPMDEDEDDDEESDPSPPMMVPVADMLNHVSNHNANLEYTPELLKMVSVCRITAGEEIFNTYGQMANWQLLHMYGFTEPYPSNSNDTADIQMSSIYKAAAHVTCSEAAQHLLEEKWRLLTQMDMVGEKGVFIFSRTGSLTDMELFTTLKILCMAAEQFEEFKENEGWEEVEDEEEEEKIGRALSYEGIPALPGSWRELLNRAARFTLDSFSGSLEADRALLENQRAHSQLGSRVKHALHVRYGQKVILHRLLQATQS